MGKCLVTVSLSDFFKTKSSFIQTEILSGWSSINSLASFATLSLKSLSLTFLQRGILRGGLVGTFTFVRNLAVIIQ